MKVDIVHIHAVGPGLMAPFAKLPGLKVAVSRFVPEKGLDLLIKAFQLSGSSCKLVIAGDADHETDCSRHLKQMIDADDHIIRTGYITGESLNQLFTHAGLFVLPSFHEGLPIALLEAMSYGLWDLIAAQTVKVYDGVRLGPLRK